MKDKILDYLEDELSPEEKKAFEAALKNDVQLQQEVDFERVIADSLKSHYHRKRAHEIVETWAKAPDMPTASPKPEPKTSGNFSPRNLMTGIGGGFLMLWLYLTGGNSLESTGSQSPTQRDTMNQVYPAPVGSVTTTQVKWMDSVMRVPLKTLVVESQLIQRIENLIQLKNNNNIQKIVHQYYTSNLSAKTTQTQPAVIATFWLLKATQLFEQRSKPTEIKAALAHIPPSFFQSEKAFYQAALSEGSPSLDLLLSRMTKEDIFYEKAITLDSSLHK